MIQVTTSADGPETLLSDLFQIRILEPLPDLLILFESMKAFFNVFNRQVTKVASQTDFTQFFYFILEFRRNLNADWVQGYEI